MLNSKGAGPSPGDATAHRPTTNRELSLWVDACIHLCLPDRVVWCDGSETERDELTRFMLADGTLTELNPDTHPGCYLHRSDPNDVARVEQFTFICAARQDEVGPNNNWMESGEAKAKLNGLFAGCMAGRTLYVVPYLMGPVGAAQSQVGVEITDSAYVALSMRIMTRMGQVALDALGDDGAFVRGLHSVGELDPTRRFICHFPSESLILSYGSGYGGNALLGKKCHALRIASAQARRDSIEGDKWWMAEHMLLLELISPDGDATFFAGAFPSACGKTNLAMLVCPPALAAQGWRVRTIGDDIAWMRIGEDGRLWAINPEAGFFGVAPGTSGKTNPNALETMRTNTIYTNVAVSDDGTPWWEGVDGTGAPCPYPFLTDWKNVRRAANEPDAAPFAHPNSRFTAPASQCPSLSPHWEDATGVPISGILFGGRRDRKTPLVLEAFDWNHGVFLGATMGSQTTAAAQGAQGVLRRDPFAMLPFCGYHMGDYFRHWLEIGERLTNPPHLFQVNWFRKDDNGTFLWPGFGENVRALIWMRERIRGGGATIETPLGLTPPPDGLNRDGLDLGTERLKAALHVGADEWREEIPDINRHFEQFGDRLPRALRDELTALSDRLA